MLVETEHLFFAIQGFQNACTLSSGPLWFLGFHKGRVSQFVWLSSLWFNRWPCHWVGSVWKGIITYRAPVEAKNRNKINLNCYLSDPDSLAQIICLSKIVQDNYKLKKVFGCLWQFSKLGFISEVWTRQSEGSPIIRIWALCGTYLSPKMRQFCTQWFWLWEYIFW